MKEYVIRIEVDISLDEPVDDAEARKYANNLLASLQLGHIRDDALSVKLQRREQGRQPRVIKL